MFWIFLLGIIALMVWHHGFRKVMLWIVGVSSGLLIVLAVGAFALNSYQEHERIAQDRAEQQQRHAAWLQQHPNGCADFASIKDDVELSMASDGECTEPTADPEIDAAFPRVSSRR